MSLLLNIIYIVHIIIGIFAVAGPLILQPHFLPSIIFILILLISNHRICWISKLEDSIEYWSCQNVTKDNSCQSLNKILHEITGLEVAMQKYLFLRPLIMVLLLFLTIYRLYIETLQNKIVVPTKHLIILLIGVILWVCVEVYHGFVYLHLPECETNKK